MALQLAIRMVGLEREVEVEVEVEVWLDALESCYSSEGGKVGGKKRGEAPRAGVASEELAA